MRSRAIASFAALKRLRIAYNDCLRHRMNLALYLTLSHPWFGLRHPSFGRGERH